MKALMLFSHYRVSGSVLYHGMYIVLGLVVILLFLRNIFFEYGMGESQYLYFNDYVTPIFRENLVSYLSNITVLQPSGEFRFNFFNEIFSLGLLRIYSLFFDDAQAIVALFVTHVYIVFLASYVVFFAIYPKNIFVSWGLALFCALNLWAYDRLYQGHFFYYSVFYVFACLYLYVLFFFYGRYRYVYGTLLLFLSAVSYIHYTFILGYITVLKLFFDCIFGSVKKERLFPLLFSLFFVGLGSSIFLLPYSANFMHFQSLGSGVSSKEMIAMFQNVSHVFSVFGLFRGDMGSSEYVHGIYMLAFFLWLFLSFFIIQKRFFGKETMISILLVLVFFSIGYHIHQGVFLKLYEIIPFFGVFRDANKFVGMLLLLFCFLIALCLKELHERNKHFPMLLSLFMGALGVVVGTLVWGGYKHFLFFGKDFFYVFSDKTLHNTIAFPSYPLIYSFKNSRTYHVYVPVINTFFNQKTLFIPYPYQENVPMYHIMKAFFVDVYQGTYKSIVDALTFYGIKYVYIYKNAAYQSFERGIDTWYKEKNFRFLFDALYEKVYENSALVIFKNTHAFPFFGKHHITFKKNNNAWYTVRIHNLNHREIFFLSHFSPHWNWYILPYRNESWCQTLSFYQTGSIRECKHENRFFFGDEGKYIFASSISFPHSAFYNGFGNSWEVSKDAIVSYVSTHFGKELQAQGYPKLLPQGGKDYKYYILHEDGTIDVELSLVFQPQKYFVIGALVSFFTGIVFFFLFALFPRFRKLFYYS